MPSRGHREFNCTDSGKSKKTDFIFFYIYAESTLKFDVLELIRTWRVTHQHPSGQSLFFLQEILYEDMEILWKQVRSGTVGTGAWNCRPLGPQKLVSSLSLWGHCHSAPSLPRCPLCFSKGIYFLSMPALLQLQACGSAFLWT